MKSALPMLARPAPPRKLESGFRLAAHLEPRETSVHDDEPTVAMPVDVCAILSILAEKGLASPLGDVTPSWPVPQPETLRLPLAVRAAYASEAPPTMHVAPRRPEAPGMSHELMLVALLSFVLTLFAGAGVAWALGAPLLPR
jgi:hypothetical protein